jgi:hypothetical protein
MEKQPEEQQGSNTQIDWQMPSWVTDQSSRVAMLTCGVRITRSITLSGLVASHVKTWMMLKNVSTAPIPWRGSSNKGR